MERSKTLYLILIISFLGFIGLMVLHAYSLNQIVFEKSSDAQSNYEKSLTYNHRYSYLDKATKDFSKCRDFRNQWNFHNQTYNSVKNNDLKYNDTGKFYYNSFDVKERPKWSKDSINFSKGQHPFMYELTEYPNKLPTCRDFKNSWNFYNQTYNSVRKKEWFNYSEALKDGYIRLNSIHWVNPDFVFNNQNLNPKKPESLVFYENSKGEKSLKGAMFLANNLSTHGKQIGGPLTVWHLHPYENAAEKMCFKKRMSNRLNISERDCSPESTKGYRSAEMMHVWFIKHPEGQYASSMALTRKVKQKSPKKLEKDEFMSHSRESFYKYMREER